MGKKVNVFGWILCVSAVIALVGVIVYIVNTTTGYIAGTPVNALVILLPVVVIACAVVGIVAKAVSRAQSAQKGGEAK